MSHKEIIEILKERNVDQVVGDDKFRIYCKRIEDTANGKELVDVLNECMFEVYRIKRSESSESENGGSLSYGKNFDTEMAYHQGFLSDQKTQLGNSDKLVGLKNENEYCTENGGYDEENEGSYEEDDLDDFLSTDEEGYGKDEDELDEWEEDAENCDELWEEDSNLEDWGEEDSDLDEWEDDKDDELDEWEEDEELAGFEEVGSAGEDLMDMSVEDKEDDGTEARFGGFIEDELDEWEEDDGGTEEDEEEPEEDDLDEWGDGLDEWEEEDGSAEEDLDSTKENIRVSRNYNTDNKVTNRGEEGTSIDRGKKQTDDTDVYRGNSSELVGMTDVLDETKEEHNADFGEDYNEPNVFDNDEAQAMFDSIGKFTKGISKIFSRVVDKINE